MFRFLQIVCLFVLSSDLWADDLQKAFMQLYDGAIAQYVGVGQRMLSLKFYKIILRMCKYACVIEHRGRQYIYTFVCDGCLAAC